MAIMLVCAPPCCCSHAGVAPRRREPLARGSADVHTVLGLSAPRGGKTPSASPAFPPPLKAPSRASRAPPPFHADYPRRTGTAADSSTVFFNAEHRTLCCMSWKRSTGFLGFLWRVSMRIHADPRNFVGGCSEGWWEHFTIAPPLAARTQARPGDEVSTRRVAERVPACRAPRHRVYRRRVAFLCCE